MEIAFITTITLIWFIYFSLFSEADRKVSEALNRLKYSLAINKDGVLEKVQLEVKMQLGIPEILSLGTALVDTHPYSKNIKKFMNVFYLIDDWKTLLVGNLFLLTIHSAVVGILAWSPYVWFLPLHVLVSLVLSIFFHNIASQISKLNFIEIQLAKNI